MLIIKKNSLPLITFVFGTRPEAIKLAPLINLLINDKNFNTRIVSTGQHKDLIKDILKFFDISLDNDLCLMKDNQSIAYLTSSIVSSLQEEFNKYPPNMVIVQGDTTSAFSAALASFYLKIPVGHVEAGLRTDNLFEPFPEEANRRLISQLAVIHFSPTKKSVENLNKEGITKNVYLTGNTVIDSLFFAVDRIKNKKLFDFDLSKRKLILATIHRRENWGENLNSIAKGLKKIIESFPDTILLIPMHPNKNLRKILKEVLGCHPQAFLMEPLSYDKLVYCLKNCCFVITDSGGLQEEAPALGKPALIIRNNTEREEAIEEGSSELVGTNSDSIFNAAKSLLMDNSKYALMSKSINAFGIGDSSKKILELIIKILNIKI